MIRWAWRFVRPAIFWSYRRGSWQYDIIVALILAFIFLVPKNVFNDRPSDSVVEEIQAEEDGTRVFWIDPGALGRASPERIEADLEEMLRRESGESLSVVRVVPAADQKGNIRAYIVYAQP